LAFLFGSRKLICYQSLRPDIRHARQQLQSGRLVDDDPTCVLVSAVKN
jgi:hypothetical protein